MRIFTEEFIESLSSDPKIALHQICNLYSSNATHSKSKDLNFHLEFYAVAEAFINEHDLRINLPDIGSGDTRSKINKIIDFGRLTAKSLSSYVHKNREIGELDKLKKHFSSKFSEPFIYEISDDDFARIQLLLKELHELISSAHDVEETLKLRLLKRVEKLKSKLHKNMADLDLFWGLVGDTGIVLGKAGKNAKPIVDRVAEITNITWKTQSRAEALPSNMPSPVRFTFEHAVR